ncbi:MAG: hypothetical protein [Siphoviridae sp. ctdEk19]|nr:MAG: hypothetical protein [Siphoviridae sp. ctdEk19]
MLANALVERRGGNFGVNVGEWPARPAALRDAAALGLPISDLDPTGLSKTALSSFAPDPKRPQHDRRLLVTPNMNTLDTAKLAVMRLAEAVRRRGTQPADVYADWNGRGSGAQRHAGRVMAMNEALRDPKNQAIRAIYDHLVQTAPRALMQGHRAAENFTPLP